MFRFLVLSYSWYCCFIQFVFLVLKFHSKYITLLFSSSMVCIVKKCEFEHLRIKNNFLIVFVLWPNNILIYNINNNINIIPDILFIFPNFLLYAVPHLQRKPLVLEGVDLGACTSKWTVDYLSQVGGRKEVKIHVAAVAQMDFISKNFVYRYFLLRFTLGLQVTYFEPCRCFCVILQRLYGISPFGYLHIVTEQLCNFKEQLLKDTNSEFTQLQKDIFRDHVFQIGYMA